MKPTREFGWRIWKAAVLWALFAAWRVYVIAHSAPDARRSQIVATVVALAVGLGFVIYYFGTAPSAMPERRLSKTAVLLISLVLIILAVLLRRV